MLGTKSTAAWTTPCLVLSYPHEMKYSVLYGHARSNEYWQQSVIFGLILKKITMRTDNAVLNLYPEMSGYTLYISKKQIQYRKCAVLRPAQMPRNCIFYTRH